jgi:hypothetical protein
MPKPITTVPYRYLLFESTPTAPIFSLVIYLSYGKMSLSSVSLFDNTDILVVFAEYFAGTLKEGVIPHMYADNISQRYVTWRCLKREPRGIIIEDCYKGNATDKSNTMQDLYPESQVVLSL